ncbi:5-oxoprolinase subunit PxpB [Micromonospora zhanjiangensis]|uniref:5-oxoprolinase subunit PxpB n=1 Tax=Micromonospora zhanjiangensis TaxID=1522057 RepID=A0ABV8KM74_9ACTN
MATGEPAGPLLRRAGRWSWLVEVDSGPAADRLHRHLAALRGRGALPGVVDLVPGARTVLLDCASPGPGRAELSRLLAGWDRAVPATDAAGPVVRVPVRYDGPDLAEVAALTGRTPAGVVAAHTGTEFTVAFCGFSPGFGYLTGLPEWLRVPRRPEPRSAVPAGAVGLAGEYTGVYPRSSPGGWQLIGRTAVRLFDATRDPPALLAPGTRVRFTAERP